jgi:WD40 repeat protein
MHEFTGRRLPWSLTFSPDSRLLVTCGEDRNRPGPAQPPTLGDCVFVWDVATAKPVAARPEGLPIEAGSSAFAPDGRTLATASADGVIRLWELATWTVRTSFRLRPTSCGGCAPSRCSSGSPARRPAACSPSWAGAIPKRR